MLSDIEIANRPSLRPIYRNCGEAFSVEDDIRAVREVQSQGEQSRSMTSAERQT